MSCPRQILRRRAKFDRQCCLGNHRARILANDVHTQQAISFGLGQDLDEAVGIASSTSA